MGNVIFMIIFDKFNVYFVECLCFFFFDVFVVGRNWGWVFGWVKLVIFFVFFDDNIVNLVVIKS